MNSARSTSDSASPTRQTSWNTAAKCSCTNGTTGTSVTAMIAVPPKTIRRYRVDVLTSLMRISIYDEGVTSTAKGALMRVCEPSAARDVNVTMLP